ELGVADREREACRGAGRQLERARLAAAVNHDVDRVTESMTADEHGIACERAHLLVAATQELVLATQRERTAHGGERFAIPRRLVPRHRLAIGPRVLE